MAYENNDAVPDGKGGVVSFEYVPESVYWKRWCDRNGFPYSGGWIDQPVMFIREIDAARRGIERYENEQDNVTTLLKKILGALTNA